MKKLTTLFLLALLPLMASGYTYDAVIDGIHYSLEYGNGSSWSATVISKQSKYQGTVTIPSTVTYDVPSQTDAVETFSVTSVEAYAFSGCSDLTKVSIPNSVTSIGDNAFSGCSSLTEITIPNSVTWIGDGAFSNCSSLTSVEISNKLTQLRRSIFYNCSSLTYIDIPSSVELILGYAFNGCTSLKGVFCYRETPPAIYENTAFSNLGNIALYVPESSVNNYKSALQWRSFGSIVSLDEFNDDVTGNIPINATNFPDEKFRNLILEKEYGKDGILSVAEISGIKEMYVWNSDIRGLRGIEFFTALERLECSNNQLPLLDVSKNTKLTNLSCSNNQLPSLDVSKNTKLTELQCRGNRLASLDVSRCTALTSLDCYRNLLTSLDVSKNTKLTTLICDNNQLTSLDMSTNLMLTELICSINKLTSLNVYRNTKLTSLDCSNNQLTSLNVSGCTQLKTLKCYNNKIKGSAMNFLINSMPAATSDVELYVISKSSEGNVMTTTQVAAAKAKGWIPYSTTYGYDKQEYAGSEPTILRGDANGDGEVGMPDVMFIVNYILGTPDASFNTEAADANLDGEVGMPDVMYIVNYILNGEFPEE